MIVGAALTATIPQLQTIAKHGKIRSNEKENSLFLLHKSNFGHFYFLSCFLFGGSIIFDFFTHQYLVLSKFLFFCHSLRRLFESLWLFHYGSSTIHLLGYICGLSHYCLVFLTLHCASLERLMAIRASNLPLQLLASSLFIGMNILQYRCHSILASDRKRIDDSKYLRVYKLPRLGLFRYCCCPHYFAEILIYFSLFLLETHSFQVLMMSMWVLVNLSVVAYQQYQYYLEHDFDIIAERNIKLIFPFLW